MKRAKIAPVLTALLDDEWDRVRTPPPTKEKAGDAQVLRLAGAELRALLAVARAADRLIVRRPGHFIVRDGIEHAKPVRDALDRLDRVSRG